MLQSLLYAASCLILDVALVRGRSGTGRVLELLALGHAMRVLRAAHSGSPGARATDWSSLP